MFAASLYHDYYFCIGDSCNGALKPQDPGDSGWGIGKLVDGLRTKGECEALLRLSLDAQTEL